MLQLSIPPRQLRELKESIKGTKKKLEKELAIAVRATTKKTKTIVNRQVRQELAINAKGVNEVLSVKVDVTNKINPRGTVTLHHSKRPSLKRYSARQTRKGVSYRIDKKGGRRTVPGAFMGPRPGQVSPRLSGHPFKRVGPNRKPIVKLHGASPWGAFKKRRLKGPTKRESRAELVKQIQRRIRFNVLKRSGKI